MTTAPMQPTIYQPVSTRETVYRPTQSREQKLRGAVHDLQGVFVTQLFKAMRDTVPEDGLTNGGAGEEMFTGMLDEHISRQLPGTWHHGLGDSLYRQLNGTSDAR